MKHYLIYFTEVGSDFEHSTEFIGDVTEAWLVDFFGLNNPDVTSYRIEEIVNPNKIII